MFDLFDKCREVFFFQKRKIGIFINLLTNAKIALGNVVNADQMF